MSIPAPFFYSSANTETDPIAMSVRSTNVYEEQSLGIYLDDNESEPQFPVGPQEGGQRMTVWSTYLAQHIRRQLSFDMWWLVLSLFLICIIEVSVTGTSNSSL